MGGQFPKRIKLDTPDSLRLDSSRNGLSLSYLVAIVFRRLSARLINMVSRAGSFLKFSLLSWGAVSSRTTCAACRLKGVNDEVF